MNEAGTSPLVRVALVDDHAVVREGYRRLLEHTEDISVIAEVASGEDAYRVVCEMQPDVTVMDINLPGLGGIETVRRIVARLPEAKILMFSMHEDTVFSSRALQAGARGYVTKSAAPGVVGVGDGADVGVGQLAVNAVDHRAQLAGVEEQRLPRPLAEPAV